jgi:CheY-like chemotaxis protein
MVRSFFATMRILVIDDEKKLLAVLERFLTTMGHDVEVAESASEALLCLARRSSFDVILCDVHMTGLDGIALAGKLSPLDSSKLVFITGGATTPEERAFLETRRVLLKPFSREELSQTIEVVAQDVA